MAYCSFNELLYASDTLAKKNFIFHSVQLCDENFTIYQWENLSYSGLRVEEKGDCVTERVNPVIYFKMYLNVACFQVIHMQITYVLVNSTDSELNQVYP